MQPVTEFTNPITGTIYRLRVAEDGWRVGKVVERQDGSVLVRHLRGTTAAGFQPPAGAVQRLVQGERQADAEPVPADPAIVFAEAVLVDLDRTASLMTAMAGEARERTSAGMPGFRPGCGHLRRQEADALAVAIGACRRMADAWRSSGLWATPGLPATPDWLVAALDDRPQDTAGH